jgi:hypothetical protein
MISHHRGLISIAIATLCFVVGCTDPIANSHTEANVPQGKAFDEYLSRDLTSYFCTNKDCRVEYEFLREGPTQTGIAYPKYYLWVRCFTAGKLTSEGAVRIAAVDQATFDVTHFISAKDIVASPDEVERVFPAALLDKIGRRARHE